MALQALVEGAQHVAQAAADAAARPFVMDGRQGLGLALSALVAFISGPGGQGGSSFYVVVFSVLLQFSVGEAAAMASFVVFAGSVASALSAMGSFNPVSHEPAPLIDYDSVLVLLPPMLLGIAWGVLMNAILADWFLNVLLLTTWCWSCFTCARSLARTWRLERRRNLEAVAAAQRAAETPHSTTPGATAHTPPTADGRRAQSGEVAGKSQAATPNRMLAGACRWLRCKAKEARSWWAVQAPASMGAVVFVFVLLIAFSVAKAGVPRCSAEFWGLMAGQFAASAVFVGAVTAAMLRRHKRRALEALATSAAPGAADDAPAAEPAAIPAGPPPADGGTALLLPVSHAAASSGTACRSLVARGRTAKAEAAAADKEAQLTANEAAIQWSARRLAAMPPVMLAVGVVAGVLGMGGGFVVYPLLLADGLHPQVVAGTSKLVLMVSMGGTALSFLVAGRLNLAVAGVYAAVNVALTPLGIWGMDWVCKKCGHPSLLTALSLARFVVSIGFQAAFSAAPAFAELVRAQPPLAGFHPQALCGGRSGM